MNYIWIGFFLVALWWRRGGLVLAGDVEIFNEIINATFASAKTGFEISLGLTGVLALWMGIMKIGERGGVVQAFARLGGPGLQQALPRHPGGAPGDRVEIHELLGEPPRTRQRRDADGSEGDARVAGAEPRERHGDGRDGDVPLHQCVGADGLSP